MTIPIIGGVWVIQSNPDTVKAINNLHTADIINNVDHLKDLPISEVGSKSRRASDLVLHILKHIDGNTSLIDDVRKVAKDMIAPIQDVSDLLNKDLRGNVKTIVAKVKLILDTVQEYEIHETIQILKQAMDDFDKTSKQIKNAIKHDNINRTMSLIMDADRAISKMDKLVSKFV
jgi:hypothetical protein